MRGIDRSKKWGLAVFAALVFGTVPLHPLFGEEAAQPGSPLPAAGQSEKNNDRSGGGKTASVETLTLSRAIEIALEKNPTILAARFGVDVSSNRVGEARSAYYPQLSASAAYTRINPVPGSSTFGGNETFNQFSSSVTLNQNILDFGKTSSQVDVSKYNLEASRDDLQSTQDSVIQSVKQDYYGVLQARRNRDVAEDVIKQFQLHLDQAKGFYDVGTKARIDVIKAEVDLSNAKLDLINKDNAFKIAWVTLKNVMGVPDAPEGTYTIEEKLTFEKYTITLDEAVSHALDKRPDYKSAVAKRQAAESNISLQQSGHYPVLSGNASYNWAEIDQSPYQLNHGWSAGVVLTVPLFSGFLTSHQVAEAKANLYILKANEESTRQQIMFDVRQAYLNLQAAEASIATAQLAADQAKENMDLANGRYAAGVGSPIEVSDAFATYVTAQANYTSALSNYKIAQASIERAMGAR
ncbi:MAG TPA: TolC family protein [Nitrospirota bacterium]|nr:TolC family protein [Nitrospirota bacterium]